MGEQHHTLSRHTRHTRYTHILQLIQLVTLSLVNVLLVREGALIVKITMDQHLSRHFKITIT